MGLRFAVPIRCLSAYVEEAVVMASLQYRRKVTAGILSMGTMLNEPG